MRKIFLTLLTFFFVFSVIAYGQDITQDDTTPTDTTTTESDLRPPYIKQCVTVGGRDEGLPPPVDEVTFTGTCGSTKGCDIGVCQGNNCTVYDGAKDYTYFGGTGGGLPNVTANGSHKFPPGQFTDLPGSIAHPKGHTPYGIYAIWEPEPLATGGDEQSSTQQQEAAKLEFPSSGDCVSIEWDPFGRVFDAISLEPLGEGEARVSLYDQAGNFVNTPTNNALIDSFGKYNIYLQMDGMYTLKVGSMANHDFVPVTPNSNYSQLYERLFKAGDPAFPESKDNPQRYDIPVKPKATPYHRDPEEVAQSPDGTIYKSEDIVWRNGEEFSLFRFRVTHPMTKVITNLPQGWVCQQTNSQYTNKEGYCLIMIKAADVPQEGVDIRFELNNTYYPLASSPMGRLFKKIMSFFIKDVNAQQSITIDEPTPTTAAENESITHFNPILRYVEGYAYNKNNEPIPKAKINVRLLNKSIYYTTTADDQGFFTIYKNNLPPMEFYLQLVDPKTGEELVKTTSEFVKDNEAYLNTERVNLMAGTKYDQPVIDPKTGKLNKIDKNYVANKISPTGPATTGKSSFNWNILLIVFILLVLFASLIGVVFYIKKKQGLTNQV